jgi:hypothetical protein
MVLSRDRHSYRGAKPRYDRRVKVDKMSISFTPELREAAAAKKLRAKAFEEFITEFGADVVVQVVAGLLVRRLHDVLRRSVNRE